MNRWNWSLSVAVVGLSVVGAAGQRASAADFVVRIEDVSTGHTMRTSKGDKAVGLSPGAWCLHTGNNPMYTVGHRAATMLERMAEDGNPEGFYSDLQFNPAVKATGAFNYAAAPYPVAGFIGPKQSFEFVIKNAARGDRLSFVTMMIESNDWFYANNKQGIALFAADGTPRSGDITNLFGLFDAGTEGNEEPGVGMNQAPRQSRPDTGRTTRSPVYAIVPPVSGLGASMMGRGIGDRRWRGPEVRSVIKITIRPR